MISWIFIALIFVGAVINAVKDFGKHERSRSTGIFILVVLILGAIGSSWVTYNSGEQSKKIQELNSKIILQNDGSVE